MCCLLCVFAVGCVPHPGRVYQHWGLTLEYQDQAFQNFCACVKPKYLPTDTVYWAEAHYHAARVILTCPQVQQLSLSLSLSHFSCSLCLSLCLYFILSLPLSPSISLALFLSSRAPYHHATYLRVSIFSHRDQSFS